MRVAFAHWTVRRPIGRAESASEVGAQLVHLRRQRLVLPTPRRMAAVPSPRRCRGSHDPSFAGPRPRRIRRRRRNPAPWRQWRLVRTSRDVSESRRRLWKCSGRSTVPEGRSTGRISDGPRNIPGNRASNCTSPARTRCPACGQRRTRHRARRGLSLPDEGGVGLEQRVVAALDAWLGRYVGSMLAPDIRNLLQNRALQLGDIVELARTAFRPPGSLRRSPLGRPRVTAGGSGATRRRSPRRWMPWPRCEIPVHARAESREECVARITAAAAWSSPAFAPPRRERHDHDKQPGDPPSASQDDEYSLPRSGWKSRSR